MPRKDFAKKICKDKVDCGESPLPTPPKKVKNVLTCTKEYEQLFFCTKAFSSFHLISNIMLLIRPLLCQETIIQTKLNIKIAVRTHSITVPLKVYGKARCIL